jgi:hypothetical protein
LTTVFITSGTTWTVPADWSNTNTIECVGPGGNGVAGARTTTGVPAAGGGAYSQITNLTLTPSGSATVQIGAGGSASDTWISNTGSAPTTTSQGCLAKAGANAVAGTTGGVGGASASGVGTIKNSGGAGGGATAQASRPGAGGGGAGGPGGVGGAGTASPASLRGGTGGGGAAGTTGAGGAAAAAGSTTSGTNGGVPGTVTSGTAGVGVKCYWDRSHIGYARWGWWRWSFRQVAPELGFMARLAHLRRFSIARTALVAEVVAVAGLAKQRTLQAMAVMVAAMAAVAALQVQRQQLAPVLSVRQERAVLA